MSTEWIVPGAKVVVHTYGGGGAVDRASMDTVKKVADKSFSLEGTDGRFDLRNGRKMGGGSWGPFTTVLPHDSDKAQRVLAEDARRRRQRDADAAVDAWRKSRSCADREAAIAALQAIADDE